MAIPDFQTIMRPLLEYLATCDQSGTQETLKALAVHFNLSDDELAALLPSGKQQTFKNRIAWAKLHVKAAGLIDSPSRGVYRITESGSQALSQAGVSINLKYLSQYPAYVAWRTKGKGDGQPDNGNQDDMTPEEHIDHGYGLIRKELGEEILQLIMDCTPDFFERLVVDLLLAMGYGGSLKDAGKVVGKGGDAGIDGLIKQDRLGLDTIYVQAKRWDGNVGRPDIQKFAGALQGQKAKKGVFITTSSFSKEALDYGSSIDTRIVMIDGSELASLMIDYDIGVTSDASYIIKKLDTDYFSTD